MPIISCIVPVYNVENYLAYCIDSILKQTLLNFELILVDDGSTDKSPSICDEYEKKDNRIKVIHKKNGGVSSARNAGLDIAQGDYITFVDSDDWVDSTYFSTLYKVAMETNADLVICGYKQQVPSNVFDGNSSIDIKDFCCVADELDRILYNKQEFFEVFPQMRINQNISKTLQCPWARLIKVTKDNTSLRFNENINNGEDYLFNLQLYKNMHTICFIKEMLYYYRYVEGSLGRKVPLKRISDGLSLIDETEIIFKEFCTKQAMSFFYKYKRIQLELTAIIVFVNNAIKGDKDINMKLSLIRKEISLKIILTDAFYDLIQLKRSILLLAIKLHLQFIYILRYKNKRRKRMSRA